MAKVIMIQGTMSGAGKSLLAAGLCRIFREDGLRTAPFKSQNMALNSYITKDGLEMGRAQAVQAEAAGIEPSVSMNPILLKPTTDTGSQVIVNGKAVGSMSARDYYARKQELVPVILEAYRNLEERYDVIVVEGAGSPAEINLKENDIVNMGLARMLHAPVLLAGDIDRGGVFAQLYGTAALLEPEERDRIRGFIINKFRGDRTILDPGIAMLRERIPIPVRRRTASPAGWKEKGKEDPRQGRRGGSTSQSSACPGCPTTRTWRPWRQRGTRRSAMCPACGSLELRISSFFPAARIRWRTCGGSGCPAWRRPS